MATDAVFERWMAGLEARHLADLRFADLTRALRALSSAYVEKRDMAMAAHRVLDGAGKRAAFALYYAPLHYRLIEHVSRERLPQAPADPSRSPLVDLGCGTGVAGAAVARATSAGARPPVVGIDTHPWALDEARRTYSAFGLDASVTRGDVARGRLPRHASTIVAAYVVNELSAPARTALLAWLERQLALGARALVVEPISKRVSPWWADWVRVFERAGGRADEWKVSLDLPVVTARLGAAAGLNTRELAARSLSVAPATAASPVP